MKEMGIHALMELFGDGVALWIIMSVYYDGVERTRERRIGRIYLNANKRRVLQDCNRY